MRAIHHNDYDLHRYTDFVDILEYLGGSEPTEDDVWEIARICEEVPIFENRLHHVVLSEIECLYSNIDEFQSELAYVINARDTHLYIDGEEIDALDDFTQAIEKSDY